jgi:secreted PhoX family phosphatase
LTAAGGFADAGETLVKTRQAADALRATRLDRAQALAVDAASGWVYAALASKPMGQVLRWREEGDAAGERFRWKPVLQAGDPQAPRAEDRGTVQGDAFANPDVLALDGRGRLWLGAGMATSAKGPGNPQLLACNPAPASPEVQRFLSGPVHSAIGGLAFTPDGSTLFVNISHPGEAPGERSDPAAPRRYSNWPDFQADGRPRSATLAVRRSDGGVIGG